MDGNPTQIGDRPRVLLVVNTPGWAYANLARELIRVLADKFDFRIAVARQRPDLSVWAWDIVIVFGWAETYHQAFVADTRRVIKVVSSHRWTRAEGGDCADAGAFARRFLNDAGTVVSLSRRLHAELLPYRPALFCPAGIDTARFARKSPRDGTLRIGWAGNAADPCKGLHDILMPAAGDDFELQVAGGHFNHEQMIDFYQGLDVICVASTAEGEPRTLLEGMASGCFVLTTDVGIVPELVHHRENGLIVRRTTAAFRAGFQWCRMNTDLIRQRGMENARTMAATRDGTQVAGYWETAIRHAIALAGSNYPKPTPPVEVPDVG